MSINSKEIILICFQNVLFYVVSDDPDWAKNYFENSSGKDNETYFIGNQNNNQTFNATDLIGRHGETWNNIKTCFSTERDK